MEESHEATVTVPQKKIRQRKKRLFKSIREQMEFYFSDANLARSRFLAQLLNQSKDGFVELEVFTTFNRMKTLSLDLDEIKKALSSSNILEVVTIDSKLYVRRTTQVQTKENVDDCTIYVENLPSYADHAWLKKVFMSYGSVCYVSLPRFSSGKLKGFAFIEFDSPEAAKVTCQNFDCVTSQDETEEQKEDSTDTVKDTSDSKPKSKKRKREETEDENKSCVLSPGKKNPKESLKNEKNTPEVDDIKPILPTEEDSTNIGSSKRKKRKSRDESSEECPATKRRKSESEEDSEIEDEMKVSEEKLDISGGTDVDSKILHKKRRRKTGRKAKIVEDIDVINLRVMSKYHWKKLRNKYLSLQRANMAQLKKMLCVQSTVPDESDEVFKEVTEEEEPKPVNKNQLEFTAGVIIRLTLPQPVQDSDGYKEKIRGLCGIAYVDLQQGSSEAYVRCKDANSTSSVAHSLAPEGTTLILQGDEEKEYWDKLFQARKERFETKQRPKKRGTQKIFEKIEKLTNKNKHIHFDENDD